MNQNTDVAQTTAPQMTNVPFNLIVTVDRNTANKIAKHYALSEVRFIDDLHLPSGGVKRGEVLNEYLASHDHTITLVVLIDSPWVKTLLSRSPMASSVWRSVESRLVGHRTNAQRNLMIVSDTFEAGVRMAEDSGDLVAITSGMPLHYNWKPERKIEAKKPVAEKRKAQGEKKVQTQKIINATVSDAVANPEGFKMQGPKGGKNGKAQIDRSKKHAKGPRPAGTNTSMYDDLYLLCKGHYGTPTGFIFFNKAVEIVAHHTGVAPIAIKEDVVVSNLFRTLITKSGRGYWGGFNLLQEMTNAAGQGPQKVIEVLNGWIATIPARDTQGKEIPQPKVNPQLQAMFGLDSKKADEPERQVAAA